MDRLSRHSMGTFINRRMGYSMKKTLRIIFLLLVTFTLILPAAGLSGETSADRVEPEKIVLKGSHNLAVGKSIRLKAAVKPAGASQEVKWKSSDKTVARVSKNGKVTGIKAGDVTITAVSAENPKVRKTWSIIVHAKPVKKIKLSATATTLYLDVHKTVQVVAQVSPQGAYSTLEWKSSDKKTATVSDSGFVTARKAGTVTITASAVDGSGKTGSITLTIEKKEPPFPEPEEGQPVHYYALLVNNCNYVHITRLPSTKHDAKAMKNALAGLNQGWKITGKSDLTGSQIAAAIPKAFEGATASDICLFYYSGHGNEDMDYNPGALMGIRYNGDSATDDLLTAEKLRDQLIRSCPGKVIVILEACGSGAVIYDGDPLSWAQSSGSFSRAAVRAFSDVSGTDPRTGELLSHKFTVLTTCEHGDYGVNLPVVEGCDSGLLTYSIVRTLGCGYPDGRYSGSMAADTNGDGLLTLGELKISANAYLKDIKNKFPDATTQVFQYFGDDQMVLFSR